MKRFSPEAPLAMAFNEDYALPAACALYSIGRESPSSVEHAHILGSGLTPGSREGLIRVADAVGIHAEIHDSTIALETLGDVPVKTRWSDRMSKDVWARLLIPEMLLDVDRCLYIDADILCLNSLEQLLKADLGGKIVGAVHDTLPPSPEMARYLAREEPVDIEGNTPYFNSGVMLMDCKKWRQAEITPQAADFARRNPDLMRFWDQDALNAGLQGNWRPLDKCWNTYPFSDLFRSSKGDAMKKVLGWSEEDEKLQEKLEDDARIIHFISVIKPWRSEYPDSIHRTRYQQIMRTVEKIIEGGYSEQKTYPKGKA